VRAWRDRVFRQRPQKGSSVTEEPIAVPVVAEAKSNIVLDFPALVADNDNVASFPPARATIRRVLDATAAHFLTPVDALCSASRTQPLVRRRQIAAYVARHTTGRSLPYIGGKMGGRDHTTILHSVRTIAALIEAGDAATIDAVNSITAQIGGAA
jgi:chromosomal replication initiation ATPase DnaA